MFGEGGAVINSAKRALGLGLIFPRVGEGLVLKVSGAPCDTGIKYGFQALVVWVFPASTNPPSGSCCAT